MLGTTVFLVGATAVLFPDLTTVGDLHGLQGPVSSSSLVLLDLGEDVHAISDLAKDDVLAVEMRSWTEAEEELRSVCTWAGVGHGKNTPHVVSVFEVLIRKLSPVDRLSASAVGVREVTTLSHEARDDAVKDAVLKVKLLF